MLSSWQRGAFGGMKSVATSGMGLLMIPQHDHGVRGREREAEPQPAK